ncbi:MAG: response regulator [Pyrinomonadaceae bacterium]
MKDGRQAPRVLVVDDEIIQRKVVGRQLARLEFIFDAAATAGEALELLRQKDFDVVLLDVQMTEMSGLELLPLIRALEDAPEVIMLTLDKSLESGIAAMRDGAYDYLTKPALTGELEIIVTRATEIAATRAAKFDVARFCRKQSSPS